MTNKHHSRRKKGGSLVFPLLLIVLGVLFLLDNIGVSNGIDWDTVWKLWPVIIIAVGLEILFGRRISFGAAFLIVVLLIVAGAAVWWGVVADDEKRVQHIEWDLDGVERAELDLSVGVGKLDLRGYSDMGDLLEADLEMYGMDVSDNLRVSGDVARGWIRHEQKVFFAPQIFGNKDNDWDLRLNTRVSWEIDVDTGVGEAQLDLADLRVSYLNLHLGIGSTDLTLPERGTVKGSVDGGIGDITINVPRGMQARFHVDRGLSDLTVGSRFVRRGDYYETEDFNRTESYIEMDVDIGIGDITIH
jgi:hypothetical protein